MSNILISGTVISDRVDFVNGASRSKGTKIAYTPTGTPEARTYTLTCTKDTVLSESDPYFFIEHKPEPQTYSYASISVANAANHSFLPGDKIVIIDTGEEYYNNTVAVKDWNYISSRKDIKRGGTYKLPIYQHALNLPGPGEYNFEVDIYSWRNPSEPDERKYYFPDENFTEDINLISVPEGTNTIIRYQLQEDIQNVYDTRDTRSVQIRLRKLDYEVVSNGDDGENSTQATKQTSIRTSGEFQILRIYRPFGSSIVYADFLPENTNP